MSYILDALKRADAERARGAVPGLHAQQWPNTNAAAPAATSNRLWMLAAAAVALVAVTLGLWWLLRAPAPAPQVTPAAAPLATAPTALPDPAPAQRPVPVPAQVPAATVPAAPAKPAPVATVAKALPTAPPTPPTSKAMAVAQPDTVAPAADKTSAPPTATATVPVPLLSELPEAMRSQVPALTITGNVYSDNPALRLLLVNNQVLPQGSTVAAGVTLEEIRPRSSTFNFRGTRFRLTH